MIRQVDMAPPATHQTNVAQIASLVSLKRKDLRPVIRSYGFVPVQPKLPTIRHGAVHLHVENAGSLPMPAPPAR